MNHSNELKALKEHFEISTGIKVMDIYEDKTTPHWKRLLFDPIDSEKMLKISEYIMMNFSTPGEYSHLIPKIHSHQGYCLALTIGVDEIQKFIIDRPQVDEKKQDSGYFCQEKEWNEEYDKCKSQCDLCKNSYRSLEKKIFS